MNNISFLLLSIFFCWTSNAQENTTTIEVYYNYKTMFLNVGNAYEINSILTFNNKESLYEMDHTRSFGSKNEDSISNKIKSENSTSMSFSLKAKNNDFVYKNFSNNEMNYTNLISMEEFFIKSSLDTLMTWTLAPETKEILSYTCQKAATEFGGRYYVAYFTDKIPINNGPWRFHGLPGLILEIESTDGKFKLEATSIEIKNEPSSIDNPFKDNKSISWEEFLKVYKKKYDEIRRNSMEEWGPSQSIPKKGIVEYIKD